MTALDWTEDELRILRIRRAEKVPVPKIAAELGRGVPATYLRARLIGSQVINRREWSADEEKNLVNLYNNGLPLAAIASTLNRKITSVRWKLDDLGVGGKRVRRWTSDEDSQLKASAGDLLSVANNLNRPFQAVEYRAQQLGIRKSRKTMWTEDAISTLRNCGGNYKVAAIQIGLSEASLVRKAKELGCYIKIEKQPKSVGSTIPIEERKEIVSAALNGAGITELSLKLGRDTRTLKAVAASEGISFSRRKSVIVNKPITVNDRPNVTTVNVPNSIESQVVRKNVVAIQDRSVSDAVSEFLAKNGVTRSEISDIDRVILGLRRKGYVVVKNENGFIVDGRVSIRNDIELCDFAKSRGIYLAA